ncbi:MAG: 2-hydroxyacyl-CoA dehydratase [Deltaproteobacteria bacterium]|nr:2-hydroxyacyl-CoA dehydratase [Candidatus Zymogenaceae bacterium]
MTRDEALKIMRNTVEDPVAAVKGYKECYKRPVFGYFCTYTPEEIIHAAGGIPFRIMGRNESVVCSDAHLQSYSCSLVRTGLDMALTDRLDFLEGAVFPHTCDSIQRLSDIWRINTAYSFHADIVLPVKLQTESARAYLIEELTSFVGKIETYTGREITADSLNEAIKLYNIMRSNLTRLYEAKKKNPAIISSGALNDCVQGAMFMPVEEHNLLMADLLSDIEDTAETGHQIRVFLVGNLCVFNEIYDYIEAGGGTVVGDDMCTGSRYFIVNADEKSANPIQAIADRIIKRPICAAKHNPMFDRGIYLKEMIRDSGAQGVIFLMIKFCDPHSFDYPYLKESIDELKMPHLLLETEMDNPSLGQIKTRIEAFMEMIGDAHGK